MVVVTPFIQPSTSTARQRQSLPLAAHPGGPSASASSTPRRRSPDVGPNRDGPSYPAFARAFPSWYLDSKFIQNSASMPSTRNSAAAAMSTRRCRYRSPISGPHRRAAFAVSVAHSSRSSFASEISIARTVGLHCKPVSRRGAKRTPQERRRLPLAAYL